MGSRNFISEGTWASLKISEKISTENHILGGVEMVVYQCDLTFAPVRISPTVYPRGESVIYWT